jgi:hypothetical protein
MAAADGGGQIVGKIEAIKVDAGNGNWKQEKPHISAILPTEKTLKLMRSLLILHSIIQECFVSVCYHCLIQTVRIPEGGMSLPSASVGNGSPLGRKILTMRFFFAAAVALAAAEDGDDFLLLSAPATW